MGGALRFAAADARRGDANHAFGYGHDHLAPGQIDVERRSQRADLALAGLHDERTGRIVRAFEQRLPRSEERRGWTWCGRPSRSLWCPCNSKTTTLNTKIIQ